MGNVILEVYNWLVGKEEKKDTFLTAEEAFFRSMNLKNQTKKECKEKLIKEIQRQIKMDTSVSGQRMCLIDTFQDPQEKEVLPEVAEYFNSKGYLVELKNGDDYSLTNILIINWQRGNIFKDEPNREEAE
jgi:hypothetical protein